MTKKRFWEGSLTWQIRRWYRLEWRILKFKLRKEFKILDHVYNYPAQYVNLEKDFCMCGYHFTNEIKKLGWSDWCSTDITSFHHNLTREKHLKTNHKRSDAWWKYYAPNLERKLK